MTREAHEDLTTRLEGLVAEYASASQRAEATAKLRAVLARVPVEDAQPAAPSEEPEHHEDAQPSGDQVSAHEGDTQG